MLAAISAVLICVPPSFAVAPITQAGTLSGSVRDVIGSPQMGAVVFLYDHTSKLCERMVTNSEGRFSFGGLTPEFYTIRVTLASFLPALRDHIQIQAGMRKQLEVNLSTLFSSIQLVTPDPGQSSLVSDDWKWVLRTSSSRRPVLRLLPSTAGTQQRSSVFSDTHGIVQVSGGDSNSGSEADLGTAFGVATSLFGTNQMEFIGNVGYASSTGLPTAGFRALFSRRMGNSTPSVSVTMRQISVPGWLNSSLIGIPGLTSGTPFLRTMSISMSNKTALSDSIDLEYGVEMDLISYLQREHYNSPYARLTYTLPFAKIDVTYTSGNARPGLTGNSAVGETVDLERDVQELAAVPRVSLLDQKSQVQQGDNYEIGVTRSENSREYRVAAYRESVKDAALTVSLPSGGSTDVFSAQILPDLFSNTSVFDAGSYHTFGYTASVTQSIAENYHFTATYGMIGVLVAGESGLIPDADSLRELIHAAHRSAVTTKLSGAIAKTGTKFSGSYQFTDYRSATSGHLYATDTTHPDSGLNLYLRQALPTVFSRGGRMEATLDLRNMLAQGYMPFTLTDGRKLLLMRTPRTVRGGLSFTF